MTPPSSFESELFRLINDWKGQSVSDESISACFASCNSIRNPGIHQILDVNLLESGIQWTGIRNPRWSGIRNPLKFGIRNPLVNRCESRLQKKKVDESWWKVVQTAKTTNMKWKQPKKGDWGDRAAMRPLIYVGWFWNQGQLFWNMIWQGSCDSKFVVTFHSQKVIFLY